MALRIQYNKTFSQQLQKQLAIRERALPTLKSKETALRIEVKKAAEEIDQLKEELKIQVKAFEETGVLLREFPEIIKIKNQDITIKNVAGVKVPELKELEFHTEDINYFNQPAWIFIGIENFKRIITLKAKIMIAEKKHEILNYARKKTTQKVNLYEKIQIPEFKEGIRKIKRYLEDEENLSKSAQKIVKERHQANASVV